MMMNKSTWELINKETRRKGLIIHRALELSMSCSLVEVISTLRTEFDLSQDEEIDLYLQLKEFKEKSYDTTTNIRRGYQQ